MSKPYAGTISANRAGACTLAGMMPWARGAPAWP
jgi:hypothetical protein